MKKKRFLSKNNDGFKLHFPLDLALDLDVTDTSFAFFVLLLLELPEFELQEFSSYFSAVGESIAPRVSESPHPRLLLQRRSPLLR